MSADIVALVGQMHKALSVSDAGAPHTAVGRGKSTSADAPLIAFYVDMLKDAARIVKPSCLRGVSVDVPKLTYDDVIGCAAAKKSLERIMAVCDPAVSSRLRHFGVKSGGGALLYGPPGILHYTFVAPRMLIQLL